MINGKLLYVTIINFGTGGVTRNSIVQSCKELILSDMLFCRKPLKIGLNAEKPHFSVRLSVI